MAIETKIEFKGAEGMAEAYLYTPSSSGEWPGVIHLTDIAGIRDANRDMAKRQSDAGYTVVLPNIYYRTTRLPIFDFVPKMGDERSMKRFMELRNALPPAAMDADGHAYVDSLLARPEVSGSEVGVIGYCFTGAMAMRIAAAEPDKVAAAASFHGGGLYTDQPESPHRLLPKIKARLYFGHAIEDRSMPEDAIKKLDEALAAWGGRWESETYPGAHHGWTVPGGPVYQESGSNRHFQKLEELFKATL
ncbi:MAG TPA: dienelactone hydrolase family protein [Rhizomicrobium sp.]